MEFGTWIPSCCYPNPSHERVRSAVHDFSKKSNEYGIDLWVIDHLLQATGLLWDVVDGAAEDPDLRGRACARRPRRQWNLGTTATQSGAPRQGDRHLELPHGRALRPRPRPELVPTSVRGPDGQQVPNRASEVRRDPKLQGPLSVAVQRTASPPVRSTARGHPPRRRARPGRRSGETDVGASPQRTKRGAAHPQGPARGYLGPRPRSPLPRRIVGPRSQLNKCEEE